MSDITNKAVDAGTAAEPAAKDEKLFTQEDVNRIVSERLAKERAKGEPDPSAKREDELARREFLLEAKEALVNKGLPVGLAEALNTSSKEAFENSLSVIEKHISEKTTVRGTFKGLVPGHGSVDPTEDDEDTAIRGAMGLTKG